MPEESMVGWLHRMDWWFSYPQKEWNDDLEEEGLGDTVEVYGRILLEGKPQICSRYWPGRHRQV